MSSLGISFTHGLGDLVQFVPALRKFKQLNPTTGIVLLTMARFSIAPLQLLSGLPYVEDFIPVLKDAWNDFPSYEEGCREIFEESKKIAIEAGIDQVILPICPRPPLPYSFRHNKVIRFAEELGVPYDREEDLHLELATKESFRTMARTLFDSRPRPARILHRQAGNPPKDLFYEDTPDLLSFPGTLYEFGKDIKSLAPHHVPLGLPSMDFTKAAILECDEVIATDSIIMHISFAFGKNTTAIFKKTPAVQACPLSPAIDRVAFGTGHPSLQDGLATVIEDVREYLKNESSNRK